MYVLVSVLCSSKTVVFGNVVYQANTLLVNQENAPSIPCGETYFPGTFHSGARCHSPKNRNFQNWTYSIIF